MQLFCQDMFSHKMFSVKFTVTQLGAIKQQKVTVMTVVTHMVPDVVGTMGMSSASVGMDQGI